MKDRISRTQLAFLSFAFVFGGTLLSRGAYRAQTGAYLSALLGCLLGVGWVFILSRILARPIRSKGMQVCFLFLLLVLLLFSLWDFGVFWQSEVMPSLPAVLCAALLFAVALFAVFSASALGRFGEVCAFLLPPLLLLLLPWIFGASMENLTFSFDKEGVGNLLQSSGGVFLSTFGDCLAIGILLPSVISPKDQEATIYARAVSAASPIPIKRGGVTLPLLIGAGSGAGLFFLTVLGNQLRLGAFELARVRYPVYRAVCLLSGQVLAPFFTFVLTLLYTVKIAVLLLGARLVCDRLFSKGNRTRTLAVLSLPMLLLIPLICFLPDLLSSLRQTSGLIVFLVFFECILPLFHGFSILLKKRFDKIEKT